jgi:hypothetical protein
MKRRTYSVFRAFKDIIRFWRNPLDVIVNKFNEQLEEMGRFHLWGVITQLALFNGSAHRLSDLSAKLKKQGGCGYYRVRIMLGVHDQAPVLPVEFSEIFFAGTERVNSRGVNLVTIDVLA